MHQIDVLHKIVRESAADLGDLERTQIVHSLLLAVMSDPTLTLAGRIIADYQQIAVLPAGFFNRFLAWANPHPHPVSV